MDPITTAIVAALPALASGLVESAVKDAYTGLKDLIVRKFGAGSGVAKSVEELEKNPKSKGQATVLSEHVEAVNATADAEIMKAVAGLVEALAKSGLAKPGVEITTKVSGGSVGVAGAGNVTIGSLNVGGGPQKKGA